jgi:translin
MGLADTIGEIRRVIVGCLMNGDTDRAKALFAAMEEISEELLMMDVPDAVVPLRRKQDIARGIMDKTRSDMLGATVRRS